jgi:hypothetical protein
MPHRQPQSRNEPTIREVQAQWMAHAVKVYKAEQENPAGAKPKSLRTVCDEVQAECKRETGVDITLNHGTLRNHVNGGTPIAQFNSEKAWLSDTEAKHVISFAVDTARRGFPLSHKQIEEHMEEILRVRLGDSFRPEGLGHNWTNRFVSKHSDQLGTYWSQPLEHVRSGAVNPTTKEAWDTLLGSTIEKFKIEPDCLYAEDESGFLSSLGVKEKVIGPARAKNVYQRRDGNRETMTVLVTICADGTSLPPTVILKG